MENYIQIALYIINGLALVSLGIGYFKANYTIIDLETWNKVANFYNENYSEETEELAGGCGGFFREYIEDYDNDDEEEEYDDE